VAISLRELQLPHEKTLVDLQDKPEEFESLYRSACGDPTMSAKVPILAVEEDVLIESMVIVEYLEECHGVPRSAAAKARCRLWATLVPSWLQWFSVLRAEAGSDAEAAAVAKLRDGMRAMDRLLLDGAGGDGPFVLGSDFSLAEAATAPFVQRLVAVLPKLRPELGDPQQWIADDDLTRLSEWMSAVCSRPSCVETLPPAEVLQESYERLLERFKAMPA